MDNKVLIATNNSAKVALYSEVLREIGLEAVSPKELGISVEVEENGKDEIENASIKALAFHKATPFKSCYSYFIKSVRFCKDFLMIFYKKSLSPPKKQRLK